MNYSFTEKQCQLGYNYTHDTIKSLHRIFGQFIDSEYIEFKLLIQNTFDFKNYNVCFVCFM